MDWDWREMPHGVEYDYTDEEFLNKHWKTKRVSNIELKEYLVEKDYHRIGQITEDRFEYEDPEITLDSRYKQIVEGYWEDVLKEELV